MLQPLMIDGRPHWESRFPEAVWPAYEDFRNFMALVWDHLGLPEPTPAQYEIAHRLQYGADSIEWLLLSEEEQDERMWGTREDIIRAFRALGKSYVTSAFVIWRLMRNPRDEHVLVVSATSKKAKEFVDQTKGILQTMELCAWLLDGPRAGGAARRDKADEFDVAGAALRQSHSVQARGITSQITGSRATLLIADDIEIIQNSKTEEARMDIVHRIRSDFTPIRKTEHGMGDLIFLGTPQTEESVYNFLVKEMMYQCFTIPVRWPTPEKLRNYEIETTDGRTVNILAPYLQEWAAHGKIKAGQRTDTRYTMEELTRAEAQGAAHFALQYMLDTSLSDAERYPLKQHDLVVFQTNRLKAPLTLQWGHHNDKLNLVTDIPNQGFSGDYLLRPLFVDSQWREYEGLLIWVDPAGRGADETAWCVMGHLGGMLYVLKVGGHKGDPAEAMVKIALDAKQYNVNVVEVEPNFGQGMWVAAFQPILTRMWNGLHKALPQEERVAAIKEARRHRKDGLMGGCTIQESEWAKGQKETRIIDTLEPVMTAHRLVVDEGVIRENVALDDPRYSLIYQLTHISRDRGSLRHEDRLESIAGAVNHFMTSMEIDTGQARRAVIEHERDQMIEDFIDTYNNGFPVADRNGSHFLSRKRIHPPRRGNRLGKYREGGYRDEVWKFD